MPAPTSTKALTFNGKTSELFEYFEYFEDLAGACSLSVANKCKMIIRYVDKPTKHFWVTLAGYKSHDYDVFKKSILGQYPGTEKGIKYTWCNLELVVAMLSNDDISMEMELLQYYRKFRPITVWLVANKKISTHEQDRYFWQGLPTSVRRAIDRWLELKNSNYTHEEPMDYEEVLTAGRFILSDDAFDADLNDPITARLRTL